MLDKMHAAEETFNSLFEMPYVEDKVPLIIPDDVAFNSLFEMQLIPPSLHPSGVVYESFNSLFEMPVCC